MWLLSRKQASKRLSRKLTIQADGCVELVVPAIHLFSRIPVNEETIQRIQEQGSLLFFFHLTRCQILEFPSVGERIEIFEAVLYATDGRTFRLVGDFTFLRVQKVSAYLMCSLPSSKRLEVNTELDLDLFFFYLQIRFTV